MALTPGQRITMIRECATLLDKYEWSDLDLILGQSGAPTSSTATGGKYEYSVEMLKDVADKVLRSVHHFLTDQADGSSTGHSPWTSDRLRLFCSHLAENRFVVGEVARALQRFGIDCFVAHDSIEPSREWQQVIEAGLQDCDAMVVFLHPGFVESKWCDQEVGWAMGRRVPVLPLNYGLHPYGFLGKFQDQPCVNVHEAVVARYVADWASKVPALQSRMAASLSYAFERSISWNHTRTLVPMLEQVGSFDSDELDALERGAANNTEVSQCDVYGKSGPEWVRQFVAARRAPAPLTTASWTDEPPF